MHRKQATVGYNITKIARKLSGQTGRFILKLEMYNEK